MIKIVTDANANVPQELVERFDITLVPAYVIFGDEVFRESFDISTSEVLARLNGGSAFPKTSQPSPSDFETVYRRILDEHPDATILSIHITGASSGTVDSARQAATKFPDASIHVFDTRVFSIAQALMVREAAVMAEVGDAVDAILERLQDMRDRIQTFFALDTVEYLYKGGRIGRATQLVGSLLNIKPMLTVRDGVMESYARLRTRSQVLNKLRELVLEAGRGVKGLRLAIGYAVHQFDAQRLADELSTLLDLEVLLVSEVGPALGVYTGPGCLGISWYTPES